MSVSLKCQYGLRALFELSKRHGEGLIGIPEIAANQAIPLRFLENIMNQLRQGGFVESRRGRGGGFMLSKSPESITIGHVIDFIDRGIYDVGCMGERPVHRCRLKGECVFLPVWLKAKEALEAVYYGKNLLELVQEAETMEGSAWPKSDGNCGREAVSLKE